MAEATFYPDAHPESTSVDGSAHDFTGLLSWADKIAKPGTGSFDSDDYLRMIIGADSGTDEWDRLHRVIILFDISGLPAGVTITGVTLTVYGYGKVDNLGITPSLNVYSSNPDSNTAIVPGDYDSLGSTPFCDTPITYAAFNSGTPGDPNNFVLNAAGLAVAIAAFAGDGILKLGLRDVVYDVGGTPPAWTANLDSYMIPWSVDKGTTYRPKLVVTYEEVVAKARSHGYIIG